MAKNYKKNNNQSKNCRLTKQKISPAHRQYTIIFPAQSNTHMNYNIVICYSRGCNAFISYFIVCADSLSVFASVCVYDFTSPQFQSRLIHKYIFIRINGDGELNRDHQIRAHNFKSTKQHWQWPNQCLTCYQTQHNLQNERILAPQFIKQLVC